MRTGLRWSRAWPFGIGGAALLMTAVFNVCAVLSERWDRDSVLAEGRDAKAQVGRPTGLDSVLIEWEGESGKLTADTRSGKVLARTGPGTTVGIKYDPTMRKPPVILSEVAERERINAFWLRSSLLVIGGLAAVGAAALVSLRRSSQAAAHQDR